MQKLPISNPNPILKQKYVIQVKIHSQTDARELTGPELADRALTTKEKME